MWFNVNASQGQITDEPEGMNSRMTDLNERESNRERPEEQEPPLRYKVIESGPMRPYQQSGPPEPAEPLRYKVIESAPARPPEQSETTEPAEPKVPNPYRVIEPEPKNPELEQAEAEQLYPFRVKAEEEAQQAAAPPPVPPPPTGKDLLERILKFA